eukprot:scaffold449707_cov53-Prasinocladus_malaysianus.AAC.1
MTGCYYYLSKGLTRAKLHEFDDSQKSIKLYTKNDVNISASNCRWWHMMTVAAKVEIFEIMIISNSLIAFEKKRMVAYQWQSITTLIIKSNLLLRWATPQHSFGALPKAPGRYACDPFGVHCCSALGELDVVAARLAHCKPARGWRGEIPFIHGQSARWPGGLVWLGWMHGHSPQSQICDFAPLTSSAWPPLGSSSGLTWSLGLKIFVNDPVLRGYE